jgi:hypothetical protein
MPRRATNPVMVYGEIPNRLATAFPPVDNDSPIASVLNASVYCRIGTDSFSSIAPAAHQKVINNLAYVKPGQGHFVPSAA